MSSVTAERIYALLPSVYRIRDDQSGRPLQALIGLIARELEALEENIEQLYDDQFIETCQEWVAPYIGDLIGYRPLHGVTAAVASPRAEVANTIAYRRRKGTAAMLEQLARDVTGWPSRAVEFFEHLATTQYMNHVRLHAPGTAAVRVAAGMPEVGGPFNAVAHTAEMRRPEGGAGQYNIPNVGLFLWRLQPYRLSRVPLTPDAADASGRKFRLNPLGADQPLFREPALEPVISHIAEPANVPAPLRVRELALQIREAQQTTDVLRKTQDYGARRSFVLERGGAVVPINRPGPAVPPGDPPAPAVPQLLVADLRDVLDGGGNAIGWGHETGIAPDVIAIDPERGRVLLGAARAAEHAAQPFVGSYHYGFSRAIGGGEYERTITGELLPKQLVARDGEPLQPHLAEIASGGRLVIEDSVTYAPPTPVFKVDGVTAPGEPGIEVVVAARNGARPLIAASGAVALKIGPRGTLVLEGLVIAGASLQLAMAADDEPRTLVLRDCTLLPGLSLNPDGSAVSPGAPSLVIAGSTTTVTLERCVTGAIHADADADLRIADCVVDAGAPDQSAIEGVGAGEPGPAIVICDSTVVGKVHARLVHLASNTIFFARLGPADTSKAPVWIERKQEGCMRFCFVPAGSLAPRRFRCLPDDRHPNALPHFTSLRYGTPGYAQLRSAADRSIREGADHGGEMGVMHALSQPQREANLRTRLDEYLRFGLHAGIFYVT